MSASHLDRELERALASASPKGEAGLLRQEGATSPRRKGNVGLLIVLLAMVGGIVVLVMMGFKDAAVYEKTVDQLKVEAGTLGNRRVRVAGTLVHGTLEHRDQPCEYRFTIKGADSELPVRFPQCVIPDTFRDVPGMDVKVTVEGKLAAAGGGFDATQVLAKCPSKYEMKERRDKGEQMPHQLAPTQGSGAPL